MTKEMPQLVSVCDYDKLINEVIEANPDKVEQLEKHPSVIGWFVGMVMRNAHGKANPYVVVEKLKERFGL